MMINGQRIGPLPVEALVANGLRPDTPVWREGMPEWVAASSLPELSYLFSSRHEPCSPKDNYGTNYSCQPQNAQYPYPQTVPHTNWLPWAIAGTVLGLCSCIGLVFGILGIVQANKANTAFSMGNPAVGTEANRNAKTMTIISLVFGGLGCIGSVIYWIVYGAVIFSQLSAI